MTTTPAPPEPPDLMIEMMSAEDLATALRYHNWRYFVLNQPLITDTAFDRIAQRLKDISPDHPALVELIGSGQGEKVAHDAPMLSLDKCYTEDEFLGWCFDKRSSTGARRFTGEVTQTPKVDGVAASFHYSAGGHLVKAVTRGDGKTGESFLPNARFIDSIPKSIPDGPAEVRGELYMSLSVFETFADEFSNPRNTTAGAIKQKDARVSARYRLSFFAYDVLGRAFQTEVEKSAWLDAQGFEAVPIELLPIQRCQAGYERWLTERHEVDYETDGVVYKVNNVSEQGRMGVTAHHPRYAIAYKFQGDSGVTTLERIEWSVSRTGAITPVGIVTPISLSGAMVSRCSLHNISIMRRLGISYGAKVIAMRRGGVIPHIETVTEPGDRPIEIPEACPSCGCGTRLDRSTQRKRNAETGLMEDQVFEFLFCSEPDDCPMVQRGIIEHFVKATEIDGFGPKIVGQLLAAELVHDPSDLFRLTVQDLVTLERMGKILATKLVANIQQRRTLSLAVFLRALGIDDLGAVAAASLAAFGKTLPHIRSLTALDIAGDKEAGVPGLSGFAEKMAHAVVRGLQERGPLIERLLTFVEVEDHIEETQPVVEVGANPVAGKSFVFTGTLTMMDRKTAQARVKSLGGSTPSGVSGALNVLVIGDKGSPLLGEGTQSSKHRKAEKLNSAGATIEIITESQFIALLGE